MITAAPARLARRLVSISSEHIEDIEFGASILFGKTDAVEVHQDDLGFHIAPVGDGLEIRGIEADWSQVSSLKQAIKMARLWIDGLDHSGKRQLATRPLEAVYSVDSRIDLIGYRLVTSRTDDGQSFMVTITPAWV